ncbi:MAG: NTP transferase domain-containing protein [Candidatus Magasanikbacteria bacterium]|jgi:bifunctional UDP-N-acetylglucosamine pyrophosphorylase / glucosamine-1-phosphate N-acetyltransferase|nr:NTP transferase domain-containing protein [Candidatus Magasanikbacteria bacterium]MBT4221192.1 NTP transferase domain-containing protein [Candidatus Magasanikbacteria bacterium]MBT4350034.1 NTP transferase domain-containing protein [Candidatus Magasanikbacteria bacterium]MBT4541988.1 NTP transferase domain-containing protein [Candidatus Magasanikbacteria bacterium]MBT6252743.1 NTP transferase domain-containing protein [Candidatus Magasanikbacteria bacterium]
MHNILSNVGVVILAAGKGTRLGCTDIPKVMLPLAGKPMVSYIVDTLRACGFTKEQVCLVVGFKKEKVKEYFTDSVSYAFQEEQKGTAHAAHIGMKMFDDHIKHILILQGDDSAFYSCDTLHHFVQSHIDQAMTISLLSTHMDDPANLGRIVRHDDGRIEVIEKEYSTVEQKKINEVSTGTFCVIRSWFEHMYPTMPALRKLGEYVMPTALAIAREEGSPYQVVPVRDSHEWFGVNTQEQLLIAESRKSSL